MCRESKLNKTKLEESKTSKEKSFKNYEMEIPFIFNFTEDKI